MNSGSIVYNKAFTFAIKVIETYRFLCSEKKEYVLSKQMLRSGTSIGANIKEALAGQSKKDFIAKLYIASKEAHETEYWLELLIETKYIDSEKGNVLLQELCQIIKILSSIILTTKNNMQN